MDLFATYKKITAYLWIKADWSSRWHRELRAPSLSGYIILLAACLSFPISPLAQNDMSESAEVEEVYVTAKRPGPALWQVTNGDNVLYIFGALQPLPEDFDWDSARVDWVISESQEFIALPGVFFSSSNPLRMLQYMRLRKLSNNQELVDVIPPSLYESYLATKEVYAPRNNDLEELRPFFVAETLFRDALSEVGLTLQINVARELMEIAGQHRVPVTETRIRLPIDIAMETLERTPMEIEIDCLETTLASIDADLQSNIDRARTWANGNITALRQFDFVGLQACFNAALAIEEAYEEAEKLTMEQWINAVTHALETNESTFAVLMIPELLDPEGPLAELRNLGYSVKEAQ